MDGVRYLCYCRTIFHSLKEFYSHKFSCEQYKSKLNADSKAENTTVSEIQIIENKIRAKPDFLFKIIKSSTVVIDEELENVQRNEMNATNLLGRRLPSRTKVPYLSRAVPLSTDHSYERCPCGAVFVTRIGKRQHQARFCKFLKNKTKRWQSNETVTEVSPVSQLTNVSEFVDRKGYLITEQLNNIKSGKTNSYIEIHESIHPIKQECS